MVLYNPFVNTVVILYLVLTSLILSNLNGEDYSQCVHLATTIGLST